MSDNVTASARTQRQSTRLPAPSLFVGPTSRRLSSDGRIPAGTAGNLSQEADQSRVAALRKSSHESTRNPEIEPQDDSRVPKAPSLGRPWSKQNDKVPSDSTWLDMQNTLEEVELNAASGVSVFSSEHARSLEGLRQAQVDLAQAWARSEAGDDANEDVHLLAGQEVSEVGHKRLASSLRRGAVLPSESGGEPSYIGAATGPRDHVELEEETENDIMLARRRRQANDQYFDRVNRAVVDVVAKLETVAHKMRDVEIESQNVWGTEHESLAS